MVIGIQGWQHGKWESNWPQNLKSGFFLPILHGSPIAYIVGFVAIVFAQHHRPWFLHCQPEYYMKRDFVLLRGGSP